MIFASVSATARGAEVAPPPTPPTPASLSPAVSAAAPEQHFYITQYRVLGGQDLLPRLDVETAVYPFLGPYRTAEDVEQARQALEQVYHDHGYATVLVQIPPQRVNSGVITLQVVPQTVGRLRVHGSRYFSIDEIKREAPSLEEGQSPNFSQVTHDLATLNNLPDRQVTPVVRPGEAPGTVDVDLNVKDTFPLHGSLELNNRYSADTTPLRVNGSVSYDNLWQLGHSIGFSFQVSPEALNQVQVFSAYYSAHIPNVNWLTLMVEGTSQDSNVNTLGGIGVAGNGEVIGGRAIIALPDEKGFYESLSLGLDYKHFSQDILIAGTHSVTPVTYYPLSAAYSSTWVGKGNNQTNLNASVNLAIREWGSDDAEYDLNRHDATGDFIYLRGDLSHTVDLGDDWQLFGKVQGQAASEPLVNSEQFSGGGLGTVRGYLESEELGDNGAFGSVELRTPSLGAFLGKAVDEWRFYLFAEGGELAIEEPLPDQQRIFRLASVGVGTRLRLVDHLNGSFDLALPLDNGVETEAYSPFITFRLWADF
jgi:hemolysin activation/secretion protein